MSNSAQIHLIENGCLTVAMIGAFWLGHDTVGAWALVALIANTVGVTFQPTSPASPAVGAHPGDRT